MPKKRVGGKVTYFPMAVWNSMNGSNLEIINNPPEIVSTTGQASTANGQRFKAVDNSPFHNLHSGRQYYSDQTLSIDSQIAIAQYLNQGEEGGSLYSMAQNLNWAMTNGNPLTENQKYVRDGLNDAMHNLGYNVYLDRYDHDGFINTLINQVGLRGSYENYSETQLKNALVGTEYAENKFLSTSYNDFKNSVNHQTFTSRAVKIKYEAKARTQVVMVGNGVTTSGQVDRQGEIVVAPNVPLKIKDVRFTGVMARRQGTQSYNQKQIELIVEMG